MLTLLEKYVKLFFSQQICKISPHVFCSDITRVLLEYSSVKINFSSNTQVFGFGICHPSGTSKQLIGGLIYVSNATRPDIAYSVGYLARSMQKPTQADWINGKRVIRYIKATRMLGLKYFKDSPKTAVGYSDASYAEEKDY